MSVYSGVAANYIGIFKNYKCVMHKALVCELMNIACIILHSFDIIVSFLSKQIFQSINENLHNLAYGVFQFIQIQIL